ncbi:putative surface protein [Reticulomyxa filosa]|uniref:Putative surface protein n=1 Tax=Reticulomyxa filosa TaxID=46433 RepID=X6MG85_RETFI|nr:putative surface protein [Reticulomyxa filosa]|eukprot:ETO12691.1 putative surface protein [Reticulomyxa filosa]
MSDDIEVANKPSYHQNKQNVATRFEDNKTLEIKLSMPNKTEYIECLHLFGEVIPERTQLEVNPYKVIITLQVLCFFINKKEKQDSGIQVKIRENVSSGTSQGTKAPWTKRGDWNKISKETTQELENEKPDGDKTLQKLHPKERFNGWKSAQNKRNWTKFDDVSRAKKEAKEMSDWITVLSGQNAKLKAQISKLQIKLQELIKKLEELQKVCFLKETAKGKWDRVGTSDKQIKTRHRRKATGIRKNDSRVRPIQDNMSAKIKEEMEEKEQKLEDNDEDIDVKVVKLDAMLEHSEKVVQKYKQKIELLEKENEQISEKQRNCVVEMNDLHRVAKSTQQRSFKHKYYFVFDYVSLNNEKNTKYFKVNESKNEFCKKNFRSNLLDTFIFL